MEESISPLDYNLFRGKYENCKQCPVGAHTNNLEFGSKTNVESELFGLTRQESKCPDKNTILKIKVQLLIIPLLKCAIQFITLTLLI